MSHRATLKDVAARAGVSPTTVSLFINGHETVCSRDTAERIRSAVSDLNYRKGRSGPRPGAIVGLGLAHNVHSFTTSYGVHQGAQGVGTLGYSPAVNRVSTPFTVRTIGVAFSPACDIYDPNSPEPTNLASQIWQGASQVTDWDNCRLLTYPVEARRSTDIVPFLDGATSGVILIPGNDDPRPTRLAQAGLPVMLVGRSTDIPDGCGAVYALERDTVDLALGHLWELGHRRIAHYAGPTAGVGYADGNGTNGNYYEDVSYQPSDIAQQRVSRFQSWMKRHAIPNETSEQEALIFTDTSWRGENVEEALDRWFDLPADRRPTAIFCASDVLALRLLEAAQARGISVPDDLSIVGVDDSPEACKASVPLTSVITPGLQIGREAARLLLRLMEGWPASSCRLAVPVERIAIRQSSAPPKGV